MSDTTVRITEFREDGKRRCCRLLDGGHWRQPRQCDAVGYYEHSGKWYCGRHDPAKIRARTEDRIARREREASEVERAIANAAAERFAYIINRFTVPVMGLDNGRYVVGDKTCSRAELIDRVTEMLLNPSGGDQ